MKKPTILNILFEDFEILEERVVDEKLGTKELDVNVKWGQAFPYITNNDRAYRPELLEREIKKINERIAKGDTVWGASYHPADGLGKTGDVSHMWKKVWMEKDGTCKGKLTIVPTTEGKNVQVLVKAGKLGISSRGFGTVTEKETKVDGRTVKYNDVDDNFKLVNPGDFVISPSVEGAGNIAEEINQLESELNKDSEGKMTTKEVIEHKLDLINAHHGKARENGPDETKKKEENKMKKTSEEFIQEMLKSNYAATARTSREDNSLGTSKTFEEWCKDGGEAITRASISHYIDGLYESVEEALEKMGSPELAVKYIVEQKKVTPAECYTEAKIAGIDPARMAEIINLTIDEQASAIATGWSDEERKCIYENARIAGRDIGSAEARKKLLDETVVLPENDKETQFENSVVARFEMLKEEDPSLTLNDVRKVMKRDWEKKEAAELKQLKISQIVRENLIAGPKKDH